MADKQISQLVAATTINNDDLFVMQQGGTAKKLSGQKLSDFVYQSAADQIERVNEAVEQTQAAVDSLEEQKNEIAETIASMAELGTDTTLTTPGMAADAAATGAVKDTALARFEQSEITGVPIATFDDGADNVPVKKLVVNIEPVQDLHGYANPWPGGGGKNLLDPSLLKDQASWNTITMTLEPNTQYVASSNIPYDSNFQVYIMPATGGTQGDANKVYIGNNPVQTTDENGNLRIVQRRISGTESFSSYIVQVEKGSTATSLSPYSNICSITGWTGANVYRTGFNQWDEVWEVGGLSYGDNYTYNDRIRSKNYINIFPNTVYYAVIPTTYTGNCWVSYYDANKNYISASNANGTTISKNTVFTTPNNAYFMRFQIISVATYNNDICINLSDPVKNGAYEPYQGETYSITFPSEAGTVYGGTLDVTNGVLTVDAAYVDLGTLTWTYISASGYERFITNTIGSIIKKPSASTETINKFYCSQYTQVASSYLQNYNNGICVYVGGNVGIRDTRFTDATAFTAAMSGVQLVYELATPITYQFTPSVVRTLLALNNIWADTGNINDLIYRKMPVPVEELENTLESMIAGVEETMEATQNYAVDKLVVAVHKLYHIDSNIASGETLVPGTNCHITTIADELTNIMATVDGYFNALGNLAFLNYQVVT